MSGGVARCLCPKTSEGQKCGRNLGCPFHGDSPKEPQKPYRLSDYDKRLLAGFRVTITDDEAIEQVRKLDEGRFNPPRSS